jgi:hypothetical protein
MSESQSPQLAVLATPPIKRCSYGPITAALAHHTGALTKIKAYRQSKYLISRLQNTLSADLTPRV